MSCVTFDVAGGQHQRQSAPPHIDTLVSAGTYYLVVDGAQSTTSQASSFGAVQLDVEVTDAAPLEQACRRPTLLRPGHSVQGDTTSGSNVFEASCAGGAQSNDNVYRLHLAHRSVVRLTVSSSYDAALYLRRSCIDASTEIACNDDMGNDNRHSRIEQTLDPGDYFVFVDGFRTGNNGTYTLETEVSRP